jgi:hypothetical protein
VVLRGSIDKVYGKRDERGEGNMEAIAKSAANRVDPGKQ